MCDSSDVARGSTEEAAAPPLNKKCG